MDLFAFIRHFDPTKVRVGKRNLAEREVKLLEMTEGRTVPLNPPATAASGDSGDSIGKMVDEENDANQEHSVAKDDDVLEEVVALDTPGVGAEKAKKKRKRKATGDASGSVYPPKKLRDDYQPLPPSTGGKSITALRKMVSEGSAIPSDATEPLVTASVTPMSDVGPVDSVSGLNLRTRPPHVRYVVSSDSSRHSGSYSEAASLVRSAADVPVVTVAVTTTVDANVATGSKAKDAPKDIEHIGDSVSAGGVDADAASISKLKMPSISSDSFYASQSLDTETMHRVYVPRWKLRAMDYDQLYSEFNVGAARQVCLGAEVRMRAEHTLERKSELEDRCAEQTTLLSEKDVEIANLRSLLSLKEAEAVEVISLRSKLSVVKVADAAKGTELWDLKEKIFALEGERNVLSEMVEALESMAASKEKSSLESAFDIFKEQVEKMQQVRVLSDRVAGIYSDLIEMVLHMDAEFYPRYLTTIAGRAIEKGMQDGLAVGIEHGRARRSITDVAAFNPFTENDYVAAINALKGVSFSLLNQLEANKDASMANVMDLLRLEGPFAETSEASQLQPSLDQLMIPIHRLEDQVIIGETSLVFSLEVAHNHVERLRGDATAHRLSLTDSFLSLVEPLSSRSLIGEASSSADFTMVVTASLSTTLAQTHPVPPVLSTEVPPSPKVVFEEEELDTTPEHVPAP
ncbi:hypothetical protein Tco_0371699 [Tanacetum coccineum]